MTSPYSPAARPQGRIAYEHDRICRIEELIDFATDQEIDELKMKRAVLKDQLYRQVRGPGAGPR